MRVRKPALILLKTFLILLIWGLISTSAEFVLASFLPLIMLAVPGLASVRISEFRCVNEVYVGEVFEVYARVSAWGFGFLRVEHEVPKHFEVVEGSKAVSSFLIGRGVFVLRYRVRPMRRGTFDVGGFRVHVLQPMLLHGYERWLKLDATVTVRQRLIRVTRVEEVRGVARSPVPGVDVSRIGVPGTDFREIREYVYGDPMKFVNWKASARVGKLMVNQYEVEGKKAVIIFLDANEYMTYGKAVRNYLECAIEIANSLSYYFIARGHKVGLYVVGMRKFVYPDVGKRQFRRIGDVLTSVEPGNESIIEAFQGIRKMILVYRPLLIIVTRPEYSRPIRVLLEAEKMGVRVMVIALKGRVEGDEFAVRIFEMIRRRAVRGVRAIEWDIERPVNVLISKVVL